MRPDERPILFDAAIVLGGLLIGRVGFIVGRILRSAR